MIIGLETYGAERDRLESASDDVFPKTFPRCHRRSLFFYDPEGNTVELVTYDPNV